MRGTHTILEMKRLCAASLTVAAAILAGCSSPPKQPGGLTGQSTRTPAKAAPQDPGKTTPSAGMPFVYTKWEQFSTENGLPNDHIFAVKADGDRVWIGTEDGLACLDKKTHKIQTWREADGLPWRAVTGIDVNKKTGEVWLALFGGGLARFSGGRFDHWHQLNSGLVNDVVYAVCIQEDNVWAATTAGASRYNTLTGEWAIYTEKNAPMEEIWNYGCCYSPAKNKVYLAIWGSGILEFDIAKEVWKSYLDPDGEMEIDLYRDDGLIHVITTGVSQVDDVFWVSTYFGVCRYDGRHWRGFYAHECGLPNNFTNNLKARSAHEAWFCTDKGLGACMDFETDTWVAYTTDHKTNKGKALVKRDTQVLAEIETQPNIPQLFVICAEMDGNDVWVGTGKGLAHGIGDGYYPRLRGGPALAAGN